MQATANGPSLSTVLCALRMLQGEEEEEEEDQPGPSSRHAQQAARPGRRPAQAPARGRQRGSLPTQQAQQEEMEVVPGGGIVSSGGWRQRRGAAPAAAAARRAVPEQAVSGPAFGEARLLHPAATCTVRRSVAPLALQKQQGSGAAQN